MHQVAFGGGVGGPGTGATEIAVVMRTNDHEDSHLSWVMYSSLDCDVRKLVGGQAREKCFSYAMLFENN